MLFVCGLPALKTPGYFEIPSGTRRPTAMFGSHRRIVTCILEIKPPHRPFNVATAQSSYCDAFTSFQISLYLARRGTLCQKYSRF
jgi:hypothetical protein